MPDFLMRIIPMAIALTGTYYGMERFEPIMTQVKTALVRSEVGSIARMISLEIDKADRPNPFNFAAYLRANMYCPDKKRDLSLDLWGRSYVLSHIGGEQTVTSPGPDGHLKTEDDITAVIRPILD